MSWGLSPFSTSFLDFVDGSCFNTFVESITNVNQKDIVRQPGLWVLNINPTRIAISIAYIEPGADRFCDGWQRSISECGQHMPLITGSAQNALPLNH